MDKVPDKADGARAPGNKWAFTLNCFKCGTACQAVSWSNVQKSKVYTCYYCGVCNAEFGRMGESPHWHYLETCVPKVGGAV